MNVYKKTIRSYSILTLLLSVIFTSLTANAAKYDMGEGFWEGDDESNKTSPYFDIQGYSQQQLYEQVKGKYQIIRDLIKQKKYAQAKQKVNLFIQQHPNQSIYYNLKAFLEIVDKDMVAAKQSFEKAIELNPNDFQAYTALAKLALNGKQFNQARQYANKALELNSQAVKAYGVLADVVMKQQGIDAAEKVLLDANSKVKGNLEAELKILNALSTLYANKKQPEKQLQLAKDLVKRNPDKVSAIAYLASAQLAKGNTFDAEQSLRQIIAEDPKGAKYQFFLARLLGNQKGKEAEVLDLLEKAASNLDNPALVLTYKSAFLIKQKQFQQAFLVAKQVDEANPEISLGKVLKGDVYLAENKYEKALQNYKLAYSITPTTKVLDLILKILVVQNKPKEVIALLENELEKNKDDLQVQYQLAQAYQRVENYELSIKYYEALLAKREDNVIVLNNLAWVYSQKKNPKALILAKKAYEKAPKAGVVADTYGYILLKNGNKSESLKVLKQAVELAPKLIEAQLHLAEAYIANQNQSKAKEILQKLIDNNGTKKAAAIKLMEQL